MNAAGSAAAEIAQKKSAAVVIGQSGAGIIRQAGGAVAEVGDGRDDVCGLALKMRVPQTLGVPRAAAGRRGEGLVADPPAAVATFHNINPARAIAAVAVVVAGE